MRSLITTSLFVAIVAVVTAEEGIDSGFGLGLEYGGGYGSKKVEKIPITLGKPVITSYQKFPYGGSYGGGYGGGIAGYGGYGYGGHGIYGGKYGKVVPIEKVPFFQPQVDLKKFLLPYENAHLFKGPHKPTYITAVAPEVKIVKEPIIKHIIQPVKVYQPIQVEKTPQITKFSDVKVVKNKPVVELEGKVPVDIKDFGGKAIVKGIEKVGVVKPVYKEGIPEIKGFPGFEGFGEEKGLGVEKGIGGEEKKEEYQ